MESQNYTPHFVWIDGSEINSVSRVRAHVVRERRRRISWEEEQIMNHLRERSQGCKAVLANATSGPLDRPHRHGLGNPELLGSGRRDPFANYPIEASSNMLELIDHCEL